MKKWTFGYCAYVGSGDGNPDMEYEAEVSEKEYRFLKKIDRYNEGELDDDFDLDDFIADNEDIVDGLEERIADEIAMNADFDCDEEYSISVYWPWE